MAAITGYRILISKGGNKCIQCGTKLDKGIPYQSPVSGKNIIKPLTGKSLCIGCMEDLMSYAKNLIEKTEAEEKYDKYHKKRFINQL